MMDREGERERDAHGDGNGYVDGHRERESVSQVLSYPQIGVSHLFSWQMTQALTLASPQR